jgi:hypothetical protein
MGGGKGGGDRPCKKIAEACKAAGFERGSKTGKDMIQCIKPLMQGQTVAGVSVNPADIAACQQKRAARMNQAPI